MSQWVGAMVDVLSLKLYPTIDPWRMMRGWSFSFPQRVAVEPRASSATWTRSESEGPYFRLFITRIRNESGVAIETFRSRIVEYSLLLE